MPSTCSLFIRNARILSPDGEWLIGDVLTRRGEIVEIEPEIRETPSTDDIEHRRHWANFVAGRD